MNVPILDEAYMEQARLHRRWTRESDVYRHMSLVRRASRGSARQDADDYARGLISLKDIEWLAEHRWNAERRA